MKALFKELCHFEKYYYLKSTAHTSAAESLEGVSGMNNSSLISPRLTSAVKKVIRKQEIL